MINSWTLLIVKAIDDKHVKNCIFKLLYLFQTYDKNQNVKIMKNTKVMTI